MDASKKQFYLDNSFTIMNQHGIRYINDHRTGRIVLMEVVEPSYFNLMAASLVMFKTFEQFGSNLAAILSYCDTLGIVGDDHPLYRLVEAMIADVITIQDIATEGLDNVVAKQMKEQKK